MLKWLLSLNPWTWLADRVVAFFVGAFKDWRRDQELIEKGREQQRLDNLEEDARRRDDAEQIRREAEGEDVTVKEDEL